jgi:cytochrome b561
MNTIASTAASAPSPPLGYDRRSISLHWLTAVLVVALWCLGQTIDWFPKDLRVFARSTHILAGVALTVVFCIRIWWRLGYGQRLPAIGSPLMRTLSTNVHYVLYVLIAATLLLGLFNTWVRGDNIFDLFRIPAFDPGNKPLRARVEDLHALFANVLLGLAAFHAAAGLAHYFIWKDEVLRRMWPRRG